MMMSTVQHVLLQPMRRALLLMALGTTALVVAGCAGMTSLTANVTSFGNWPPGRALGSYWIDRLPSQQQGGQQQAVAEAAAKGALQKAGFTAAVSEDKADVVVQISVRHSKVLDPWAGWGWYGGRAAYGPGWVGPYRRPGFAYSPFAFGSPFWADEALRDQSEVALLLIDRGSRKALYEARARYESRIGGDSLLPSLFEATLQGFPDVIPGERRVTVPYARDAG
jgi:Domain of unknown function (DUF4136)